MIDVEKKIAMKRADCALNGLELVLLNLTGKKNRYLDDLGFKECTPLHVRDAWSPEFANKIAQQLQKEGVHAGCTVMVALPMHVQLRDCLLVAIATISGNQPTVLYGAGEGEKIQFSRYLDFTRFKDVCRGLRRGTVIL